MSFPGAALPCRKLDEENPYICVGVVRIPPFAFVLVGPLPIDRAVGIKPKYGRCEAVLLFMMPLEHHGHGDATVKARN